MQNHHLIQNDLQFQWSVFIILNRDFHAVVLTKFPLSLFNTLSCPYFTTDRHANFQRFFYFSIIVTTFNGENVEVQPVETAVELLCMFGYSRVWPATFDALLLVIYWYTYYFFLFHHYILTCMNILIRALQRSYLILTYPVWILNPNFAVSFLNFGSIFGIQGKVSVCFLSLYLLLLLLLILLVFFTKLLIIYCNVLRSCPFSQNVSVSCSISTLKYFSEQILVALARTSLNMLLFVSEGIQECGLICTFVGDGLR